MMIGKWIGLALLSVVLMGGASMENTDFKVDLKWMLDSRPTGLTAHEVCHNVKSISSAESIEKFYHMAIKQHNDWYNARSIAGDEHFVFYKTLSECLEPVVGVIEASREEILFWHFYDEHVRPNLTESEN